MFATKLFCQTHIKNLEKKDNYYHPNKILVKNFHKEFIGVIEIPKWCPLEDWDPSKGDDE